MLVIIDTFADKLPKALDGTQMEKVVLVGINEFFPAPSGPWWDLC